MHVFVENKLRIIEENNDFVEEEEVGVKTLDELIMREIESNEEIAATHVSIKEACVVGF